MGLDGVLSIPQVVPHAQRLHVPRGAHPRGGLGVLGSVSMFLALRRWRPHKQRLHMPRGTLLPANGQIWWCADLRCMC